MDVIAGLNMMVSGLAEVVRFALENGDEDLARVLTAMRRKPAWRVAPIHAASLDRLIAWVTLAGMPVEAGAPDPPPYPKLTRRSPLSEARARQLIEVEHVARGKGIRTIEREFGLGERQLITAAKRYGIAIRSRAGANRNTPETSERQSGRGARPMLHAKSKVAEPVASELIEVQPLAG